MTHPASINVDEEELQRLRQIEEAATDLCNLIRLLEPVYGNKAGPWLIEKIAFRHLEDLLGRKENAPAPLQKEESQ